MAAARAASETAGLSGWLRRRRDRSSTLTSWRAARVGKHAVRWTRLSCHSFDANQVRLQLHVLAYNLGSFLRRLALPASVKHWMLTTLREKLIRIGGEDGTPRPIRDPPNGRGGDPSRTVSGHSASHPPVRYDLPEGRTDMTGRGDGQHDDRIRALAMVVAGTPPEGPIDHQNRRLSVECVGSMDAANPEGLGFLGAGVIMEHTETGGVAGTSSNGKCQLRHMTARQGGFQVTNQAIT